MVSKKGRHLDDYLANESVKKDHGFSSWLSLVFLCMTFTGVNAGLLKQVEEKELLTSNTCSQTNFYSLKQFCHTDEIAHNMTIDSCNFKEQCGTDENPVCLNTDKMCVFVCLRKDLTCPKGRIVVAWQDYKLPNRVYLQEVDCPDHTFQPTESDCIHACRFLHRNVSDMSEKYIVSSEGDNVSPTKVYCNFKKGYYNPEGKHTLNYDQDEIWNTDFCLNVIDDNPCMKGKVPLPDGLCVNECEQGFERNPPDFHCRQMDITSNTFATKIGSIATQILPALTTVSAISTRLSASSRNIASVDGKEATVHNSATNETIPAWGYVIIGAVVVAFICLAFVYYLLKQGNKSKRSTRNFHSERNTSIKIHEPNTVNICAEHLNPLLRNLNDMAMEAIDE